MVGTLVSWAKLTCQATEVEIEEMGMYASLALEIYPSRIHLPIGARRFPNTQENCVVAT